MNRLFNRRVGISVTAVGIALMATSSSADHAWGNYHWARTANPFALRVGDNVGSSWDDYLNEAINDWNASAVLNLTKVDGGVRAKNCRPTAGRIEVCNGTYGA